MKTVYTIVSFEKTPITEVGAKANEILALGWRHEETLPDRWTVKFSKDVPEEENSASADDDIKRVMGDYWFEPPSESGASVGWVESDFPRPGDPL